MGHDGAIKTELFSVEGIIVRYVALVPSPHAVRGTVTQASTGR